MYRLIFLNFLLSASTGLAMSDHEIGLKLFNENKFSDAEAHFKKQADLENPSSQLMLGKVLEKLGRKSEAINQFQRAADLGLAAAQNLIGLYKLKAATKEPEFYDAAQWFQKAAAQHYSSAHINLACMLHNFRAERRGGLEGGDKMALYHLIKAKEAGKKSLIKILTEYGYSIRSSAHNCTGMLAELILEKMITQEEFSSAMDGIIHYIYASELKIDVIDRVKERQ